MCQFQCSFAAELTLTRFQCYSTTPSIGSRVLCMRNSLFYDCIAFAMSKFKIKKKQQEKIMMVDILLADNNLNR